MEHLQQYQPLSHALHSVTPQQPFIHVYHKHQNNIPAAGPTSPTTTAPTTTTTTGGGANANTAGPTATNGDEEHDDDEDDDGPDRAKSKSHPSSPRLPPVNDGSTYVSFKHHSVSSSFIPYI
jgi:hypothetical protein